MRWRLSSYFDSFSSADEENGAKINVRRWEARWGSNATIWELLDGQTNGPGWITQTIGPSVFRNFSKHIFYYTLNPRIQPDHT